MIFICKFVQLKRKKWNLIDRGGEAGAAPSGRGVSLPRVVVRRRVRSLLHHLVSLLTNGSHPLELHDKENPTSDQIRLQKEESLSASERCAPAHRLRPVHALLEILHLQLALLLGPGLPDAVRALDPLLLEGVAARRVPVGLVPALQQEPLVHVDAQPRPQLHERHGAAGVSENHQRSLEQECEIKPTERTPVGVRHLYKRRNLLRIFTFLNETLQAIFNQTGQSFSCISRVSWNFTVLLFCMKWC